MRMVDLIQKKRDGHNLQANEIQWIIENYTASKVPDYQMAAWAMAVFFRGMSNEEVSDFTLAVANSGDTVDLSSIPGIKVDKHSTGGVGDTTTLILAPLVASCGVPVAKMTGRGLGHTGGTLDKLDSISGFHGELDSSEFIEQVNKIGVAVTGQSGDLAPADKKLYALRDVTATIESIPLIAASVMGKKIAAGADAILLDVKVGSGAFMKDIESARELAALMVAIGNQVGRKTAAVLSRMEQPLGYAVGNALEVQEALEILRGFGAPDLKSLCENLASIMLLLAKKAGTREEALAIVQKNLENGKALQKFREFVEAQGGDSAFLENPNLLPQADVVIPVESPETGFVRELDAHQVGMVAMLSGAGRATKEDNIDLGAGIRLHKKVGDQVEKSDVLAEIHTSAAKESEATEELSAMLREAYSFSKKSAPTSDIIIDTIGI